MINKFINLMVVGQPWEAIIRKLYAKPRMEFKNSSHYWENRYSSEGNSGAGSYGRLAEFKASVINKFVKENEVNYVIEFGCGDGNQLSLSKYPSYLGLDVSSTAVKLCRARFKKETSKNFSVITDYNGAKAELALSLDVIFHLVEDEIFSEYMKMLFKAAELFVCIYSSNYDDVFEDSAEHVRHRNFAYWVQQNEPDFELIFEIKNIYPYDVSDPNDTSFADFFFFKRINR